MSTTAQLARWRPSRSFAPRSSSNRDRDPTPSPTPSLSPSRVLVHMPRPPSRAAPTGSPWATARGREVRRRRGVASGRVSTEWNSSTTPPKCRPGRSAAPDAVHRDAFMRLVEAGWDAEAARGRWADTTWTYHVDVEPRAAALHLGPLPGRAPNADTSPVMPPVKSGSNVESPSGWSEQPAQIKPAAAPRPRAARPHVRGPRLRRHPAVCVPTTSGTGKTRPQGSTALDSGGRTPSACTTGDDHDHRTRRPSYRSPTTSAGH